jgi:hypothetical protein
MDPITDSDNKRMMQWIGLICFFLLTPPAILYSTYFIIKALGSITNVTGPSPNITRYFDDAPMITLAFYSGVVGAVLSYIYGRTNLNAPSDRVIMKMAKLLFGGALGVVAFFLSSSALIIKFLYPKFPVDQLSSVSLGYESIILLAFLAGLIGPAIVKGLNKKSEMIALGTGSRQQVRASGQKPELK